MSLGAALGLELLLGQFFFIAGFPIPLTAVVLFLWSWGLDLGERIFWGLATGVFLDGIYPEFFGVYMIVFFALALLVGLLRSYLSSAGPFFTVEFALFLYLFIFVLFVSYVPLVFGFFHKMPLSLAGVTLGRVLAAAFLWPLFFVLLGGGIVRLRIFIKS